MGLRAVAFQGMMRVNGVRNGVEAVQREQKS